MKIKKHDEPFIYINFTDESDNVRHWQFKSPEKVIIAETIADVIPSLKKVQQATEHGFYVAGFLSYEAAAAFHDNLNVHPDKRMPLLWFGVFTHPLNEPLVSKQPFTVSEWLPQVSKETYGKHVDHILNDIKGGKTEQVNYTIPFQAHFTGDAFAYYNQLKDAQSANYSAFLNIGEMSILSTSPELFFGLREGKITTRPMKGTIERGKTYEEDTYLSKWLQMSKKNRNENKLIVDLMRTELERIAKQDSIQTTRLYDIEKYPTIWQMTSTITAEITQDKALLDIFQALFPCGSITGHPKQDTMQLITNLESTPRGIYCGTIGFMTPQQEAVFNVPIRTVMINNATGLATYNAGGAITEASTIQEEYDEVLAKKQILTQKMPSFQLLESLGLKDGSFILLEQHFERLQASASYFNFKLQLEDLRQSLKACAHKHPLGHWKVRLLASKEGTFDIKVESVKTITKKLPIALAKSPIHDDLFLYHKTTNRGIYDIHKIQDDGIFDTLLWNAEGELTEFTIGNLVIELNGKYYTPPTSAGLLAGTYRANLLNKSHISEHSLTIDDLKNSSAVWLINSVREWVPVYLST